MSAGSTTSTAELRASVQPQRTALAMTSIPASSPLLSSSIVPSATFNGSLESTNEGVPPSAPLEGVAAPSEAPMRPVKKGKGTGKRLTDRERVEILELVEKSGGSLSNAEIARRYGITRAAIQKLKAKGSEVRARYRYGSAETRDDRKRGGHVMSVPFERELYEWVRGLRARKVPVPPSLVKEKAKLLVPKYGLGNFQASNGWYYNFCKRFNLVAATLVEKTDGQATASGSEPAETVITAEEDKSLDVDQAPQLQQMAPIEPTVSVYEQQLQQYHQQMAVVAAVTLQQQQHQVQQQVQQQVLQQAQQLQREQVPVQQQVQESQQTQPPRTETIAQETLSRSDRMLALLEQQNALLERQNSMIEDQAKAMKNLYAAVMKTVEL